MVSKLYGVNTINYSDSERDIDRSKQQDKYKVGATNGKNTVAWKRDFNY